MLGALQLRQTPGSTSRSLGSALMLASNFRFGTEDVDIAELETWPDWLTQVVTSIADRNGGSPDRLNDVVTFHLSPLAVPARDLIAFGTFPLRSDSTGITGFAPSARYMLALKLKALRVSLSRSCVACAAAR